MIECWGFCINEHGYQQMMEETSRTCQHVPSLLELVSCLTALAIGSHRVANIKNPWPQGEDFLAGLGQDIQSYSLPIPVFSLF